MMMKKKKWIDNFGPTCMSLLCLPIHFKLDRVGSTHTQTHWTKRKRDQNEVEARVNSLLRSIHSLAFRFLSDAFTMIVLFLSSLSSFTIRVIIIREEKREIDQRRVACYPVNTRLISIKSSLYSHLLYSNPLEVVESVQCRNDSMSLLEHGQDPTKLISWRSFKLKASD